ncbi:ester cyclase [Nocardia terpenica]|uniref:SnoaL-like domain-containing protein n=1 Tax=Nocardia terpenica TaxID=455432 RepID=A0A6G9ZD72_9NOCA|nr:nuclear transport factor 2 family protein [Nocardia terpenica]QIS23452.1 hypothetical protein F6W96_39205 [Nocardia terpenica]
MIAVQTLGIECERASIRAAAASDFESIVLAIVREAVNEGDFTVINEHVASDIVDISPQCLFTGGRRGLVEAIQVARYRMPDLIARVHEIRRADCNEVLVGLMLTGTYAGDNLAPTAHNGKTATWRQRHTWWFRGYQITAHRGEVDTAALYAALGPPY